MRLRTAHKRRRRSAEAAHVMAYLINPKGKLMRGLDRALVYLSKTATR